LKRVVVSLAKRDTTLKLHDGILRRLPRYTQIIMLVERTNLETIKAALSDRSYGDRTQVVAYDGDVEAGHTYYLLFRDKDKLVQVDTEESYNGTRYGTLWAQDLFEVTTAPTGDPVLLTSVVHRYFSGFGPASNLKVVADNVHLARLDTVGLEVRQLPIAFKGGNVLVDSIAGRRVAFCGGDTLRTTRTASHALTDVQPSDSEVVAVIGDRLNVNEVVVVSRERLQPVQMYHLDLAMTLLPNRIAAVARIVTKGGAALPDHDEIKEAQRFLAELRSALRGLGYTLVDIDTFAHNVMNFQHYVNLIPYIDAETGQRTILMPVFPRAQTDYDKELVVRNTAVLASLGYEVVHVPTHADELTGGIHCLVNVLE